MTIMSNQRHRTRIVFIALCCGVLLASLICRLYVVQIVRHEDYLKIANRQHKTVVPIHPRRGNIYDRNLRIVAASTFLDSVYVDCTRLRKSGLVKRLARDLARALDQPYENILKKIDRTGYVPIARMIEPAIADRVRDFCPPKAIADEIVNFERESKRHYPKWPLAYYVLGDVQLDGAGENRGKSGLEYQYNTYIRGKEEQFSALRSAGAPLEWTGDNEVYWAKAFGNELVLTIDESIQHIVERALHEAATEYHVRAGVLVVQNCKTGELLGLASWPECDPTMAFDDWHNRAVEHAFTVGSVMKIFTASSLIETGKLADLDELVNCNNGRDYFPPRRVPVLDAPDCRLGIVPFRMAFYRSSNVGLARMGQRLDRNAYARVLSDFGFGQKSSVDLPGESPGIFRPVSQWTAHSVIVLPFGGEMAVTPVQLVTAVSAVANGGLLVKPRIVKEIRTHDGQVISRTERTVVRRVINPVTCARVLELMESVVGRRTPTGQWEEGTGRGAAISGYRVGGKTGTFQYESNPTSYTASFVAVVPLPDPELTVFCLLDQPRGKKHYGGEIAAPVVREVAEHALRILGIPPSSNDHTPANVALALTRARDTSARLASASSAESSSAKRRIPRGEMPDLLGLSMREAAESLASSGVGGFGVKVSFEGTGIVVAQEPAPRAPLARGAECRVVFGSASAR